MAIKWGSSGAPALWLAACHWGAAENGSWQKLLPYLFSQASEQTSLHGRCSYHGLNGRWLGKPVGKYGCFQVSLHPPRPLIPLWLRKCACPGFLNKAQAGAYTLAGRCSTAAPTHNKDYLLLQSVCGLLPVHSQRVCNMSLNVELTAVEQHAPCNVAHCRQIIQTSSYDQRANRVNEGAQCSQGVRAGSNRAIVRRQMCV